MKDSRGAYASMILLVPLLRATSLLKGKGRFPALPKGRSPLSGKCVRSVGYTTLHHASSDQNVRIVVEDITFAFAESPSPSQRAGEEVRVNPGALVEGVSFAQPLFGCWRPV